METVANTAAGMVVLVREGVGARNGEQGVERTRLRSRFDGKGVGKVKEAIIREEARFKDWGDAVPAAYG